MLSIRICGSHIFQYILWAFSGFGQVHEYFQWNANYKSYKTIHWPLHFIEDVLSTSEFSNTQRKKTTVTGQTIHSPWFIWNHCKWTPYYSCVSCVSEFSGYTKPISTLSIIKLERRVIKLGTVSVCVNNVDGKLFNQPAI